MTPEASRIGWIICVSNPNSSEAMEISTYSEISYAICIHAIYDYHMNIIWISYEYHMHITIIWILYEYHMISLSPVSLSLIHQMFNPHDVHVARYVDLNLPGFEALGTTNIASGKPGNLAASHPSHWKMRAKCLGKMLGEWNHIFHITFDIFFDNNLVSKKPGLQSSNFK